MNKHVGIVLVISMSTWAYFNINYQKRKVMENIVAGTDWTATIDIMDPVGGAANSIQFNVGPGTSPGTGGPSYGTAQREEGPNTHIEMGFNTSPPNFITVVNSDQARAIQQLLN